MIRTSHSRMKQLRPYQQEVLETIRARLKEVEHPLLVNASVGAGKSLIIAELLKTIEKANWNALCLTMNSSLIRQNAETYALQGGNPGIYCAALKSKEINKPIIFASPVSVTNAIKEKSRLSQLPFNLIIIDESHNINFHDPKTAYMRIINHYSMLAQIEGHKIRFVGLTGTPYRGKNISIVGKYQFFQEEVCSISTDWLINEGYLVEPHFGLPNSETYDFSRVKIESTGQFNGKQLQQVLDKEERLTAKIMQEVTGIVSKRNGAFIFASTRKHCDECLRALPLELSAIITGETPAKKRERILMGARNGEIKYLINVNCLTVGVDVPNFDTVVFVRPTESLILYTQAIGRGLRIHENKTDCLVLDYAGNLERHGTLDHPIINKALNDWAIDNPDYCMPCYECNTLNKVYARRCIGVKEDKRCDHYFEFKNCPTCEAVNDIVARECRKCGGELIDPNAKLEDCVATLTKYKFHVFKATYSCSYGMNDNLQFRATYSVVPENQSITQDDSKLIIIRECYTLSNQTACNVFYGKFIKLHCPESKNIYPYLDDSSVLNQIILNNLIKTPLFLECHANKNTYKIISKYFT